MRFYIESLGRWIMAKGESERAEASRLYFHGDGRWFEG